MQHLQMAPSETACIKARKLCMVRMNQFSQQTRRLFEIRCALVERNYVKFYLIFALRQRNQTRFELSSETF